MFNEEANIFPLYEKLVPLLAGICRPWEVIFVNDGSTDGSASLLDRLAEQDQRGLVLHIRQNYGQTAAMMAGFDFSRNEVIIPFDGDLHNDPADTPNMLRDWMRDIMRFRGGENIARTTNCAEPFHRLFQ